MFEFITIQNIIMNSLIYCRRMQSTYHIFRIWDLTNMIVIFVICLLYLCTYLNPHCMDLVGPTLYFLLAIYINKMQYSLHFSLQTKWTKLIPVPQPLVEESQAWNERMFEVIVGELADCVMWLVSWNVTESSLRQKKWESSW